MCASGMKRSQENGKSPLGLAEVGQDWFMVLADWDNPAGGDRVCQATRHIVGTAETTAKANRVYLPYQCYNYASRNQYPLASYGAVNVAKLRAIAAQYDPEDVYQALQNGG